MQSIVLPVPPSVNRYWRAVGRMVKVSAEGRAYRDTVRREVEAQGIEPLGDRRLSMRVVLERADNRRADLDNILKALLDSLAHAGVYQDDGQIDRLLVERGSKSVSGGRVLVEVGEKEKAGD